MEPSWTRWTRSNAELRRQSMQLSWHRLPPQASGISYLVHCKPTWIKGWSAFKIPPHQRFQTFVKEVRCKAPKNKISTALVPSQHSLPRHIEVPWLCVASWRCQIGRLQQGFNQLPRHILRQKGPARVAHSQCLQRHGIVSTTTDWERVPPFHGPLPHPCFRSWSSGCKGQDLDHLSQLSLYDVLWEVLLYVCEGSGVHMVARMPKGVAVFIAFLRVWFACLKLRIRQAMQKYAAGAQVWTSNFQKLVQVRRLAPEIS